MALSVGLEATGSLTRSYTVQIPDNPAGPTVPAIIVFHGGGQDAAMIALRWGVDPVNPVAADLAGYLLVLPESDPRLGEEWVHFQAGDSGFPTLDLEFVQQLLAELTTPARYATGSVTVPFVSADPTLLYAAGFSNGGGMVWQLLNSGLSGEFRGFAAVGKALDPEKVTHYTNELSSGAPAPAPVAYVQGTADRGFRPPFTQEEAPLDMTLPAFTVRTMLERNQIPHAPAATSLIAGSAGITEVVTQLFDGGTAAFLMVTVINGGHNWPTPTTRGNPPVADHFDATAAIVEFWRGHAGLPF